MKRIYFAILCGLLIAASATCKEEINGIYYHLDSTSYTARVLQSDAHSYSGDVYIHSTVTFEGKTYEVKRISGNAFSDCTGLTSIKMGSGIQEIGSYAFSGCSGLTSAQLSHNIDTLKHGLFEDCTGLETITIPSSVTVLEGSVFSGCTHLKSITISSGVTLIGTYAFYNCTDLDSIKIPNNVKEINTYAFSNCTGLKKVVINGGVEHIRRGAFMDCTNISELTIKEGVGEIHSEAFSGCNHLVSVVIPNSVSAISSRTFYGCSSLKSVIIGNGVTSISRAAFMDCTGLDTITIPQNVSSIGDSVFYNCNHLKYITCKSKTPPSSSSHTFYTDCNLYVQADAINAYKEASNWQDFKEIRAYDYLFETINPVENKVPLSDENIVDSSYTISGDYNAGKGSSRTYPMPNKGVKLRLFKNVESIQNAIEFSVNSKWKIEGISLVGTTNTEGVETKIKNIYIDGAKYEGKYNKTIPAKDDWEASYVVLDNISALRSIVIEFESSIATQANFCYSLKSKKRQLEPTANEEVHSSYDQKAYKVIKNGSIQILRGDKTYTLTGQELK